MFEHHQIPAHHLFRFRSYVDINFRINMTHRKVLKTGRLRLLLLHYYLPPHMLLTSYYITTYFTILLLTLWYSADFMHTNYFVTLVRASGLQLAPNNTRILRYASQRKMNPPRPTRRQASLALASRTAYCSAICGWRFVLRSIYADEFPLPGSRPFDLSGTLFP